VLGGTGFIGRHVVAGFCRKGLEVAALHRGRTPVPPGCESLIADRREPTSLAAAIAGYRPDVLVDMLGYAERDAMTLAGALPPRLGRLVVVSSGDVYATYGAFLGHEPPPATAGPINEQGALRSHHFPYRNQADHADDLRYDYDKILVEKKLRELAPCPVTIVRLPMVYGPGDPQRRVQAEVERFQAHAGDRTLSAAEAAWRCTRGFVEDVADAIVLAGFAPGAAGQTYNVGEPDALSQREWLELIGRAAGWPGRVLSDPGTPPSMPADWSVSLVTSTLRIREQLGYSEAVGREEGVRRTVRTAA
jgi:nucleoside-diphosphate-sugar epimerase